MFARTRLTLLGALAGLAVAGVAGCGGETGPAERPATPDVVLGSAPAPAEAAERPRRAKSPRVPRKKAKPRPASRLSAAQLAGQRMVFAFAGTTLPPPLVERIRRGEAAGVILFGRNVRDAAQVRRLTRELQSIRRPAWDRSPLVVMTDQEGGEITRVPGAAVPSARALGAAGGDEPAYRAGESTAGTLRAAGVNVDLAPVADVGRAASALGRQDRLFGSGAARVEQRAIAFSAGLADGGVAATAKHFPGFGSAQTNTDYGPVDLEVDAATLRWRDMRPFAGLVNAGVPLVMLSTATFSDLAREPAALSRAVTTGLLRRELGFGGVTVTDDLETPALAPYGAPAAVATRAAAAGNDLLLFAKTYEAGDAAAAGLAASIRGGGLDRAATRAAAARVLKLRAGLSR